MESRSTRNAFPLRSWGTVLVAVVSSVVFVLGTLMGYSPFTAFRPAAVETPLGTQAPCMDIGMSGNAAWDRMSSDEYARANRLTRDLGMGRVRIGANWGEIERARGTDDWSPLDTRVRRAREAGVTPLLVIQSVPDWLDVPTGPVTAEHRSVAGLYGEFAGKVAARYGDQVDGYEIWNEPNLHHFWPNPDVAFYFEILKAAYPAIRAADPDATVISGGLAPVADTDRSIAPLTFLSRLYDMGGREYLDAVGMHPYSYPELPSGQSRWNTFRSLDEVEQLMRSHGDGDKKIWLTEFGAPTGGLKAVSPQHQAAMVVEAFQLARSERALGPIFIYTLVDGDAPRTDSEYHFGLYYEDRRPKPVVGALQEAVADCTSTEDRAEDPAQSPGEGPPGQFPGAGAGGVGFGS